jgi:diguanylate cyclase (GGDEF)-like protein
MIVFLRPKRLVQMTILLWSFSAAPIMVYLLFHPDQLHTPRGMDLMMSLGPFMGVNLCFVAFYSRLETIVDKLFIERLQLKYLSERDTLTGVFNRGTGERIMKELMTQPDQPLGIILCDVDRFKQINDTYGHLVGDRVLQKVSQYCQSHLRKKDTLIRWGGEEFLILVSGGSQTQLKHLAERLCQGIAAEEIPEVGTVTASFGVVSLQANETLEQAFERADQALYQAKILGRNQVILV